MKWKPSPVIAKLLPLLLLIPFLSSCNILGLIEDLFTHDKDEPLAVPQEVADLAGGIFDLVGLVFGAENSDPTLDTYPDGMSVAWVTQDEVLRITLTDFAPPDEVLVRANGSITLTQESISPWTIGLSGTIALSNHTYGSVAMIGTAVWAMGEEPGDAEPQSITGSFTVDGRRYSLADVVAAIADGDDDGDGDEVTVTPLPDTFLTSAGDYSQFFEDRIWRPGPAVSPDAPWSSYHYMNFLISADGTHYTLYRSGEDSVTGRINWFSEGGEQKIDFLQGETLGSFYEFTVLDYSPCHLHLRTLWGDETMEWIFSAGLDCLTGIVVDQASIPVGYYSYNVPLVGARVELWVFESSPEEAVSTGLVANTDSRGYFEFVGIDSLELSETAKAIYHVTMDSYADTQALANQGVSIAAGAQVFDEIYLTALD